MIELFHTQNITLPFGTTPFPNPPTVVASGTATTQVLGGETYKFGSFTGTTFAEGNGGLGYGGAVANLFNNAINGGYEFDAQTADPRTVAVLFPQARLYNQVSITPAWDGFAYYPSQFTVLGSNTGTSWVTLLTVSSVADWNSQTPRTWNFTNSTPYLYYAIRITQGSYTAGGGSGQKVHPSAAVFSELKWSYA